MMGSTIPTVGMSPARQLLESGLDVYRFLLKCQERHGCIFQIQPAGVSPYLVVADPGVVNELYQLSAEAIGDYPANSLVEPIFGRQSIVFQEGDQLRKLRRYVADLFSEERVGLLTGILEEETAALLPALSNDRRVDLVDLFFRVYRRVNIRLLFGRSGWPEFEEASETVLREMTSVRAIFQQFRDGRDTMKSPARKLVDELLWKEWQTVVEQGERGRDTILSTLAANSEVVSSFDEETICDFVFSAYLTGYVPPASATAWVLYELMSSPDLIDQLIGECGELNMGLVRSVFFEVLRYYNPLPFTTRILHGECELGGYRFPSDTRILIAACLIHRNENWWSDPDAFQAHRFLAGAAMETRSSFIPFGGGFHRCLGIHFAPLLVESCLRGLFRSADPATVRLESQGGERADFFAATMRPRGPIWMRW